MFGRLLVLGPHRPPPSSPPFAGMLLVVLVTLMAFGSIGLLFWAIRRRAKQSDAAFIPLGFTASWYFRGRQYEGVVAGRRVHAWVLPPARYRGASVGITMQAGTRGKLSVGPRMGPAFVRELFGSAEVAVGPDFAQHVAKADDPSRLHALASDPRVRAALLRVAANGAYSAFLTVGAGELDVKGMGEVYAGLCASTASLAAYLDDIALVAAAAEAAGA